MSAGKTKSRTNSSWTFSTYTFEAPRFFSFAPTGSSTPPFPPDPTDPSSVRSMWNGPFETRHLQVKAVLRLVEHGRLRTLHHLVRDLLPAVGGKAVHDDRVPVRDGQQALVH